MLQSEQRCLKQSSESNTEAGDEKCLVFKAMYKLERVVVYESVPMSNIKVLVQF